ncbi:MAG: hypothetical protein RLZZ28_320 [Bacteroidota bacterium]|jgi:magnesium-transporting ATPase (P-type)
MTTDRTDNNMVISYLTIRKAIGWLGMLLPFILLAGNFFINHFDILNNSFFINTDLTDHYTADSSWKPSISHYYYSTVGELFTGVLSAVALFMFSYKGFEKLSHETGLSDSLVTNLAGVFAMGVVVFPTDSAVKINDNIRSFTSSHNTGLIHLGFAALFFIALSVMCIVNFRRTGDAAGFGKKEDHNFYLLCGTGMLVCIGLIFIYSTFLADKKIEALDRLHPVFSLESVALVFFGSSWLKKGKVDFSFLFKKLHLKK